MDMSWIALLVIWGIVEGIQALRKRSFPSRMKAGAVLGVLFAALATYGQAKTGGFTAFLVALAIFGTGALIIYWVRVGLAKLWTRTPQKT